MGERHEEYERGYAHGRQDCREEYAAIGARAVEPPSMEWQLIETAPKDGTHVLVGFADQHLPPTSAHWFGPPDLPGLRAGGWYLSVQQFEGPRINPTHWMALPIWPNRIQQ